MSFFSKSEISSFLNEKRIFNPPTSFVRSANLQSLKEYQQIYKQSIKDSESFWAEIAEGLDWFQKWTKVLEWKPPFARWFINGTLNASYNCLDRHLENNKDKLAIIWEGEPGDVQKITYQELFERVCKMANILKDSGVKKGDRVIIYLPMLPEAPITMLACSRIGAVHSVVFAGYSAEALKIRIKDAKPKVIITADGFWRKGAIVNLKNNVDLAVKEAKNLKKIIVVQRSDEKIKMKRGRDYFLKDLLKKAKNECVPTKMQANDPLFILYTSGTTGKPKGIVHGTGGYLTQAMFSAQYIFDLKQEDVMWCTADVGWITGHSYVVYGPLLNGVTTMIYEGAPTQPRPDRFWKMIDTYKTSIFYTAPTAIRMFIKLGDQWPQRYSLESLRLIGSVGEPINPEVWMWYFEKIGRKKCPIVDTWWQTETGSILITPLPGATPTKPGSATLPFFGIEAEVVDKKGKKVKTGEGGYLIIKKPWPSMLQTVFKDDERYKKSYWNEIKGVYFSGDGARQDKDGYFWIMGRVDDIIKVAGHRLGTMEIESVLVAHSAVIEAAVVGRPDAIKGEEIVAFIVLDKNFKGSADLLLELKKHVRQSIGPIATPAEIYFVENLPKTRSGKIIRRILKHIANKEEIQGDTSTLEDETVLENLRKK